LISPYLGSRLPVDISGSARPGVQQQSGTGSRWPRLPVDVLAELHL